MRLIASIALCLLSQWSWAFTVPQLTGPVMDQAGMISEQDRREIERLARAAQSAGIAQLQVLTLTDLAGEPIEQVAIQVAEAWKLGDQQTDLGVLLLVAQRDRKIRIEVGQGLEGLIPDLYASRIIRQIISPSFRSGDFSQGILLGVRAILSRASGGEEIPSQTRQVRKKLSPGFAILFFLLFYFLIRIFGGGRRSRLYGLPGTYWGGGGGGAWPGGGGFSGGGWSGGGGGFSGGGASGGW